MWNRSGRKLRTVIEVGFDEVKIGVGGAAEVFQLGAGELDILTGGEFFVDAGGADFVADGELLGLTGLIGPGFVPDPDVVAVVEELATMTERDGTEESAAVAGFEVDEVAAAGSRRED